MPLVFRGFKPLRLLKREPCPIDPATIDVVVLHAQLDHSGSPQALVRSGFHGGVYLAPSTAVVAEILVATLRQTGRRAQAAASSGHFRAARG